jgi:hypothetical protein
VNAMLSLIYLKRWSGERSVYWIARAGSASTVFGIWEIDWERLAERVDRWTSRGSGRPTWT